MRVLVTGGAGFIGSHLCDFLLAKGCEVICMDNLLTGSTDNIAHHRDPRFLFVKHDVTNYIVVDGAARLRPALREPGLAHRLPGAAHPDAEGRRARHAQGPRAGAGPRREVPARLHLRGLRRPARAPAARGVLGQREPGGPARRLRRGQALRRGHDHGLPPRPRRSTRASCASSTPTARACGSPTAAPSRPSSGRRSAASPSPSTATARRRARSPTSPTSSTASGGS